MATVLVVDDSGYARRTHRRILESGGHVVIEATSGMEAIEHFFLDHPDLVLLDLSMEDMGGLDVLRKFREMDASARVIVISADIQRSTEQLVADAGALRFLGKPAAPDELLAAVSALAQGASR